MEHPSITSETILPTVQGEDAIVPEGVTQRSADVDEIELVVTVFVGKGCDDAAISVTDDRRVVSDCADIIEFGGSFVPVSVDRQIQQERDSSAVSSPSVALTEGRAVVVLAVALCPVRNDGVSVRASDTVWKELFELVAVFWHGG